MGSEKSKQKDKEEQKSFQNQKNCKKTQSCEEKKINSSSYFVGVTSSYDNQNENFTKNTQNDQIFELLVVVFFSCMTLLHFCHQTRIKGRLAPWLDCSAKF